MKVWVDNELIDDGDFNYIGSRLVHRYDTEGERDAAITAPANGALAYVEFIGLTMWRAGSWRVMVPVPPGGTTGQVLAKASGSDFDLEWITP